MFSLKEGFRWLVTIIQNVNVPILALDMVNAVNALLITGKMERFPAASSQKLLRRHTADLSKIYTGIIKKGR